MIHALKKLKIVLRDGGVISVRAVKMVTSVKTVRLALLVVPNLVAHVKILALGLSAYVVPTQLDRHVQSAKLGIMVLNVNSVKQV